MEIARKYKLFTLHNVHCTKSCMLEIQENNSHSASVNIAMTSKERTCKTFSLKSQYTMKILM